ncbi:MAG: hypothetical protein JWN64_806 [Parcubacteria group bacterium]|nr:hypothetical protein [Parcubacteria group bacterium]
MEKFNNLDKPEEFNLKTRKEIDLALNDIKSSKGLSSSFTNAKDARAYLKKGK